MTPKSTLRVSPVRVLVYGKNGVGKSTLAASAPRPLFIASEDGLENIDAMAVSPSSWEEMLSCVDEAAQSKDYDTIVIDSVDWFEPLAWDCVCRRGDDKGPKKSIEDFGYGKGYLAALNEWRILISKLSSARSAGKGIVLIAHSVKKTVKNLAGEDYDAWNIKLNERAAGLLREWVDIVGFAETEIVTSKYSPNESVKGIATGKRVLRTNPSAIYESKTRFDLPAKVPLEWSALASAIVAGSHAAVPAMKLELDNMLTLLGDQDVIERSKTFLSKRGENAASLRDAIAVVKQYLLKKEEK